MSPNGLRVLAPFVHVAAAGTPLGFTLVADPGDRMLLYVAPAACDGKWPAGVLVEMTFDAGFPDAFGRPLPTAVTGNFMTSTTGAAHRRRLRLDARRSAQLLAGAEGRRGGCSLRPSQQGLESSGGTTEPPDSATADRTSACQPPSRLPPLAFHLGSATHADFRLLDSRTGAERCSRQEGGAGDLRLSLRP